MAGLRKSTFLEWFVSDGPDRLVFLQLEVGRCGGAVGEDACRDPKVLRFCFPKMEQLQLFVELVVEVVAAVGVRSAWSCIVLVAVEVDGSGYRVVRVLDGGMVERRL